METTILNALRFNLTAVTPHTFLRRIVCLLACSEQVKHLSAYLSEITIQEFHFLKYRPSVVAISAIILALYTIDMEPLPDTLRLILKVRFPLSLRNAAHFALCKFLCACHMVLHLQA